jgi:hypothetical protein
MTDIKPMTDPHAAETLREMAYAIRKRTYMDEQGNCFDHGDAAALDTALQAIGIVERMVVLLRQLARMPMSDGSGDLRASCPACCADFTERANHIVDCELQALLEAARAVCPGPPVSHNAQPTEARSVAHVAMPESHQLAAERLRKLFRTVPLNEVERVTDPHYGL